MDIPIYLKFWKYGQIYQYTSCKQVNSQKYQYTSYLHTWLQYGMLLTWNIRDVIESVFTLHNVRAVHESADFRAIILYQYTYSCIHRGFLLVLVQEIPWLLSSSHTRRSPSSTLRLCGPPRCRTWALGPPMAAQPPLGPRFKGPKASSNRADDTV